MHTPPAGATLTLLRQALPAALCARWLQALAPLDGRSRHLPALPLDADAVLQAVHDSPAWAPLLAGLGPDPICVPGQCWLRHGRPPHHWHQDGALGHDFLAHAGQPAPADAALQMRTLWIALTPCGGDAPGLEWVDAALPGLLSPADLTPGAVAAFHGEERLRQALLAPGDALLFDGLLLHRTHLTAAMQAERTSLELRWFSAAERPRLRQRAGPAPRRRA